MNLIHKNKDFRLILLASMVTRLSDSIMVITILWSIYSITNSPTLLGLITLMQLLPVILLSLHSGTLADRYNPKTLMITCDFSRFALFIMLIVFWYFDLYKLILLYIIVFLLNVFSSYFEPASQVTIKNIVKSEDLIEANSLLQLIKNFSNLFGLFLGGTLVGSIGIINTFWFNAFAYLLSALIILKLNLPKTNIKKLIKKKFSSSMNDSFKYLRNAPISVKQSLLYLIIINISVAPLSIIMTLLADQSKLDSYGLGLLNGAFAIGSILGSTVSKIIIKLVKSKIIVQIFIFLYCSSVFFAVIPNNIWISSMFLLLTGVSSSLILIFVNAFIQRDTDKEYMGRISSIRSMALRIPPPIVALFYGSLVSSIGLIKITLIVQLVTISFSILITMYYKNKEGSNYNEHYTHSQ